MTYYFSPSELNYITCKRCFYLKKIKKFEYKGSFPRVFNDFDLSQKNYFIEKNSEDISKKIPKGQFFKTITKDEADEREKENKVKFNILELPATIKSAELKDNKKRTFILGGKPDLVVKFKNDYGVLDFKTTGKANKTENYKHQLEAYAQILENPDNDTPKLCPISKIGLIQFTPEKITSHDNSSISQKMKMQYFEIDRNEKFKKNFYTYVTELLDILEKKKLPIFDARCELCNYAKETTKF
tara:strand:- start:457 stop:1182 length:726 start_codon:yes stop_codon:yes gene_type:complete